MLVSRAVCFLFLGGVFALWVGQIVADELGAEASHAKQSMLQMEQTLGQLDLSDEQKKSIEEVISNNRRLMRVPYKKMLEAKKVLEKSGYVYSYNHQVVTQMAQQMGEAIETLQILQVTMQQQIFSRLTDSQKEQLLNQKKANQTRRYQ